MIKISICIPTYNNEKTIIDTIKSCEMQEYLHKEILVVDDCSTDRTCEILKSFPSVRVVKNDRNLGIGLNLAKCMKEAKGNYVVYMCADDMFADKHVVRDIVKQFNEGDPAIGIIGRMYYEFIDGKNGAVGVFRDRNILTASVNPSGMAFRRDPDVVGTNAIFVEMPFIVKQYLSKWRWTMLEYDSVAVRIHPGGNTGTKSCYYRGSAVENWKEMIGINVQYYPQFIQIKNHAPSMLWREITSMVRINPESVYDLEFWAYTVASILLPSCFLKWLSRIKRDFFQRKQVKILERE